jgi:hypothetical protein
VTPTVTPTTTQSFSTDATASAATALPSIVRTTNKRTIGIAVGVSIAAVALIAAGVVAYLLRGRNRRASREFTTVRDAPPLPTPQPHDYGTRAAVDDRWQASVLPREMHQNIHAPPQAYGFQTTPSPNPHMNSDGRSWTGQSAYTAPPLYDPNMNAAERPWNQITPPNSGSPLLYDNRAGGYNHRPEL